MNSLHNGHGLCYPGRYCSGFLCPIGPGEYFAIESTWKGSVRAIGATRHRASERVLQRLSARFLTKAGETQLPCRVLADSADASFKPCNAGYSKMKAYLSLRLYTLPNQGSMSISTTVLLGQTDHVNQLLTDAWPPACLLKHLAAY
jgi:hypothetical protein